MTKTMVDYALDSDIFSLYQAQHPTVVARVLTCPPDQLHLTAITIRERLDGWYRLLGSLKTPEDEARVYSRLTETVKICATMRILPYDIAAIAQYKALHLLKLNVRPMDLRVAAIALEQNAVVVTRNTRDFERIPHLLVEDWTKP